jgi:hypothetical protein
MRPTTRARSHGRTIRLFSVIAALFATSACSSGAAGAVSAADDALKGGIPANGKDKPDNSQHAGQAGAKAPGADNDQAGKAGAKSPHDGKDETEDAGLGRKPPKDTASKQPKGNKPAKGPKADGGVGKQADDDADESADEGA